MSVYMVLFRLVILIPLILRRAALRRALLRVQPNPTGSCVKDNLHLLSWLSEPKLTLVPHILLVYHVDSLFVFLDQTHASSLLVFLGEAWDCLVKCLL